MQTFKIGVLLLWAIVTCFTSTGQSSSATIPVSVQPLPQAHAHNDYAHEHPLFDALDNGFTSVEADVYLVNGIFYVYHDLPARLDAARTLENLYLKPLAKRVRENNGRVYPGYSAFFYLMIDVKSDGQAAYPLLKKLLRKYQRMLSVVRHGEDETGKPVKVFVSGNRPVDAILQDNAQIAALDGRPADLGRGIPPALMPVVSDHYNKFLTWNGEGPVDRREEERLHEFVQKVHAEGKKVRLWATPDTPQAWAFLLEQGVDLINTDRLPELKAFLLAR